MTTFTLFKTKSGRLLITTEQKMDRQQLDEVMLHFDQWSKGPDGATLLIPDCAYAGEIDETPGVVFLQKHSPELEASVDVAGGKSEATSIASRLVADGLVDLLGDKAMGVFDVRGRTSMWEIDEIRTAFMTDPRFEETAPASQRWQLTEEAAANRSRP